MENQYLWPLVGVALGWLLNTLSTNEKIRFENKKVSARLLSKLIQIRSQVEIYRYTTTKMKSLFGKHTEYEEFRIGLIERHFLKPDTLEHDLKSAIDEYSSLYPLTASKLESTYQSIIKLKTLNLKSVHKDSETYKKLYRTTEINANSLDIALLKHINECAFHHSVATYLRVKFARYIQKIQKSNPKEIDNFKGAIDDLNSVMDSFSNNQDKNGL
ncbi:hypothetical protein [Shewanella japonica]|uniref:hypothetical protein n=1 Tax=Shewanella japonica TaxID=93973 RepID=UPI000E74F3CE|nr:hypothetical protein [Shewanella japonica]